MTAAIVVLAGGGTAGHVTPALAVASALRRADPQLGVEFVGSAGGLESRLVPGSGWTLHTVEALPLRGRRSPAALKVPFVVGAAARRVARLLRERNAVAACVFGGYVSGPLALAARLTGIPLVLHEQNAVPGLANRLAARWARVVAVSVPDTAVRFRRAAAVTVTGNPVRAELAAADLPALRPAAMEAFGLDPTRRTLLAFGGSLGARRLNDAVTAAAWQAPARLQVLLIAGARDHDRVRETVAAGAVRAAVTCVPFVERMELAYAAADLVVCRAGASTIAELTALGLPAVLVPYPHAAADEQAANARALQAAGAATMLADAALDGMALAGVCEPLLADDGQRAAMAAAARRLGHPDAAQRVADVVLAVAGRPVARPAAAPGSAAGPSPSPPEVDR